MDVVMGVFHASSTRDGEALVRDGQPFFDANALGVDAQGERLFEVRFDDGVWMLAAASDLDPTPEAR